MYYFIINQYSHSGRGIMVWNEVKVELEQRQIAYETFFTEGIGHARSLAHSITAGARLSEDKEIILVVLGGDGTLNEVLDGMSFPDNCSLAYIPAGSGNDFARALKMPRNRKKLLNNILQLKRYRILDYGVISYGETEAKNRRFIVSTGIGFDAEVCIDVMNSNIRKVLSRLHLEKLSYVVTGIKQLFRAVPSNGYLILDDTRRVDFNNILFISSHILKYEGGGFAFAPKADPSDGLLEVCAISNLPKHKLIVILVCSIFGKHIYCKGVRTYRCKEIRIHTEKPMAVHTDGEFCGRQTNIVVRCIEKKVRVIV